MPDFQPPELSVTLNCIALLTGTRDATVKALRKEYHVGECTTIYCDD